MNIEEKFHEIQNVIEHAGRHAREYFDSDGRANEVKGDGSVVTVVDRAIERELREYIETNFPDDAIVGEEEDNKEGSSVFVWHVDPIDGTDNFLRKIPFCCISVARLGDTPEDSFAVIHNPITGQTFASLMENGVYENTRVAELTKDMLGGRYLIGIGRGREAWMKSAALNLQKNLYLRLGKCLSYGSTALELAYVAANRIDAFLTFGLSTYDYGAGLFLVKAAGGAISEFKDGAWQRYEGSIKDLCDVHGKTLFVSHPDVHEMFLAEIGDPASWTDNA